MEYNTGRANIFILLVVFIISRLAVTYIGVSFDFDTIYSYWQYLDVESLEHNLLQSLWYQHSQPPVFNLLLGVLLKCCGDYSTGIFTFIFLLISFLNACLILRLVKSLTVNKNLPLFSSLFYMLSPATILFENELFYTEFVSMLLLLTVYFYTKFKPGQSWLNALGTFVSLTALCLTRSIYHLVWLIPVIIILIYPFRAKKGFRKLLLAALVTICIVGGWYAKNYFVFGKFSTSSWTGINFARIVFKDVSIKDSSNIAAIHPFLPVSYYGRYITQNSRKYAGLNDDVLMNEMKNDSFVNMNHVNYIDVSDKYLKASRMYISAYPLSYLKNVLKAFIIFFSPASSYFQVQDNYEKICVYDALYSFNPSVFAKGKEDKRFLLALAAVPKFSLYLLTFLVFAKRLVKRQHLPVVSRFSIFTILFVLGVSTMLDYGENMRFRYEVEPLFIIILAQAIGYLFEKSSRPVSV